MAEQTSLFHDSIYDAAGSVVIAAGGKKKVSKLLWPHLKDSTAETRLSHCLSDEFPEKLGPEEMAFLRRLGREIGCHAIAEYEASEAGYAPPQPVNPVDEAEALRRDIRDLLLAANRKMERLDRTESRANLRSA
jgi:hypothetical protein